MDLFTYTETIIQMRMTSDEARQCVNEIKSGLVNVGKKLLELYERDGWKALGYSSWRECGQAEFGFKQSHIYRLLDAAEVERNISPIGEINIPESQARVLAPLEPDEQRRVWAQVLEEAKDDKITAALIQKVAKEIDQEKRDERRTERIEKLAEISTGNKPLDDIGLFPVLYADPPWQYDHPISDSRRIENQYPTMAIQDICALPVQTISTPDAILFMWTSTPMLEKALIVMSAWEFDYRTSMVWIKPSIGPGQWVRQRHELLLIGVKGNIPTPRGEDKPDSVIEAPREEHSKKPEIVYNIIERMYPELQKVELFCRDPRDGWIAWGNEI